MKKVNPYINYPTILSSYKMYDYCKKQYPNREVIPVAELNYEEFIYWTRTGEQRMVRNKNEIWVNDWDAGFPYIKRIR